MNTYAAVALCISEPDYSAISTKTMINRLQHLAFSNKSRPKVVVSFKSRDESFFQFNHNSKIQIYLGSDLQHHLAQIQVIAVPDQLNKNNTAKFNELEHTSFELGVIIILSMPLGPRDVRTASATERPAEMLAWRTSSRRLVSVKVSVLDECARTAGGAETTAAIDGEMCKTLEKTRSRERKEEVTLLVWYGMVVGMNERVGGVRLQKSGSLWISNVSLKLVSV